MVSVSRKTNTYPREASPRAPGYIDILMLKLDGQQRCYGDHSCDAGSLYKKESQAGHLEEKQHEKPGQHEEAIELERVLVEDSMTQSREARECTEVQSQRIWGSREMTWLEEIVWRIFFFNRKQEANKTMKSSKENTQDEVEKLLSVQFALCSWVFGMINRKSTDG